MKLNFFDQAKQFLLKLTQEDLREKKGKYVQKRTWTFSEWTRQSEIETCKKDTFSREIMGLKNKP